jgi:short subunit fatty acids transporter
MRILLKLNRFLFFHVALLLFHSPELLGQRYRKAAAHPAGITTMTSPEGLSKVTEWQPPIF